MIRDLLFTGHRLSGLSDARFRQGIAWAMLEGVTAATMYVPLILLLRDMSAGMTTPSRVMSYALAMLTCLVLRIIAGRLGVPMLFAGAYAMMGEARLRIADHLRHLPMGWFARQRDGDLSARLTSDLELIEHLWSHFLGSFVSGLAMSLTLLLILAWVDWRLALIVLTGLPLALIALTWTQHAIGRPGEHLIVVNTSVQSALLEYVQGIAVIRSFGRYGEAWRQLVAVLEEQHAALVAIETKPTPWMVSYAFLLEAGYICLMFAGTRWLTDDTLTPLTLIAFLAAAAPMYRQLFEVGLATMMLRFSRRALRRIESLLTAPMLPEPTAMQARTPGGYEIVFDRVRFAYDGVDGIVLDGVSCSIPSKGLTAVVGPSGAGKTTLVNLIARLWDVQDGSIRLGGVDLREIGTDALHRYVAMVSQDVILFSGSVLENLRIGQPQATLEQAIEAAKRAQAHDFIMTLPQGYDTALDEGGCSLSGGERQRLSIARALLKDAPILLLDEASTSVDPSAEAEIQRAIAELARGRTVVVIAHRLKNVRHADHILVMNHGHLAEQGRHDELLAQGGLYARLWSRQQVAQNWDIGIVR